MSDLGEQELKKDFDYVVTVALLMASTCRPDTTEEELRKSLGENMFSEETIAAAIKIVQQGRIELEMGEAFGRPYLSVGVRARGAYDVR